MTINRYFIIVFLFLLTFALRVHRFGDLGTHADEGVHVTIAEQLLAGDLLYRDLFENHTPGVDLLLAATFKVTGSSVLFSRLWSIGAAMVTVAALLIAAQQIDFPQSAAANKQRVRDLAGFTASLLFACAPLAIFWSRLSVLTSFKTAAATLSLACALRALKKQSGFWWLLAGMMAGFALLAKGSGLVVIGTLGLFLTFWCLRKPSGETIRAGLFCLLGMLVAWLPIAIMLLTQETVGDFFHLLSGVERLDPLADWEGKLVAFQNWSMERPFIPLALLGGILALRAAQPASFLLLIWAAMELIALLLLPNLRFGWNGFSHYALPFIAAASLLASYGLAYGWQLSSKTHHKLAFMALALLLSIPTFSSLVRDLKYSVYETSYPLPDIEAEVKVGQALALVTPNKEPILVLANSIFYHRANRPPANRYFHYPSYLPTSSLATESEAELTATLQDSDVGAVLLSTVHRTQRLPPSIVEILFEEMVPVTSLSYPYQNDLLLFLPKQKTTATVISEPIEFESDILLNTFAVKVLGPTTLLVQLDWSTMSPLVKEYTVFTHLIGADGERVSQHDGWPVMNFRQTTTWLPGESVMDWHWLELPSNAPAGTYDLQVGLYDAQTGQRLRLQTAAQPDTTFVSTQIQIFSSQ